MFQTAIKIKGKILRNLSTVTVLLLLIAVATIPLHSVGVNSVYSQSNSSQAQPSDEDVGGISDLGGFQFPGEPIDFSQFGDFGQFSADSLVSADLIEFDFGGFFAVFWDSQLFESAGGDFGDFAGVFGSFEDFNGEFNDFIEFGGSFDDLGGFFNPSNETLEAFALAKGLTLEDLDILEAVFAYDLIKDPDFFGFHDLGPAFVASLLRSAGEGGDLGVMSAEQWAGVLGALENDDISSTQSTWF